jgi:hypothetical protein
MFAPQAEYERRGDVQDVVAGGPKGRDASADTYAWMRAEILSYSRSRGLFAGVSLVGSTIRLDDGRQCGCIWPPSEGRGHRQKQRHACDDL